MLQVRMSAPGLRSRYVVGREKAVLAFASGGLVVTAASPAYRILPLGAKPQTAFFMGVLWWQSGKWKGVVPFATENRSLTCWTLDDGTGIPRALGSIPNGTLVARRCHHKTPMNSRAGLHPLAVRLHGRLERIHRPAFTPLRAVRPVIRGTRARCACMGGTKRTPMNRTKGIRANHPWGSYCH